MLSTWSWLATYTVYCPRVDREHKCAWHVDCRRYWEQRGREYVEPTQFQFLLQTARGNIAICWRGMPRNLEWHNAAEFPNESRDRSHTNWADNFCRDLKREFPNPAAV